jgi:cytochrome c oxidase accessory protein FixG
MCPWPRIQSAMLDEKSLIVTYKDWRGEPRASIKKAEKNPGAFGDCIDCRQCVAVCPTGIDIREGAQIGCITCALCIDACDRVMKDIGRPRGLIDYATLEDSEREKAGAPATSHLKLIWHPRTLVYFAIWCAIGAGLLFALGTRKHIDLAIQKDRNPPFMLLSQGEVRNAWTFKLKNMENRPRPMKVTIEGLPGAVMWTDSMPREKAARELSIDVPPDTTLPVRAYVMAPAGTAGQDFAFVLAAQDAEGGGDRSETHFSTPGE